MKKKKEIIVRMTLSGSREVHGLKRSRVLQSSGEEPLFMDFCERPIQLLLCIIWLYVCVFVWRVLSSQRNKALGGQIKAPAAATLQPQQL